MSSFKFKSTVDISTWRDKCPICKRKFDWDFSFSPRVSMKISNDNISFHKKCSLPIVFECYKGKDGHNYRMSCAIQANLLTKKVIYVQLLNESVSFYKGTRRYHFDNDFIIGEANLEQSCSRDWNMISNDKLPLTKDLRRANILRKAKRINVMR